LAQLQGNLARVAKQTRNQASSQWMQTALEFEQTRVAEALASLGRCRQARGDALQLAPHLECAFASLRIAKPQLLDQGRQAVGWRFAVLQGLLPGIQWRFCPTQRWQAERQDVAGICKAWPAEGKQDTENQIAHGWSYLL
jgi:hypothetical protein